MPYEPFSLGVGVVSHLLTALAPQNPIAIKRLCHRILFGCLRGIVHSLVCDFYFMRSRLFLEGFFSTKNGLKIASNLENCLNDPQE